MCQSSTVKAAKQPPEVLSLWSQRHTEIKKLLREIDEGRYNMGQTWDGVGSLGHVKETLQGLSDMLHGRGEFSE